MRQGGIVLAESFAQHRIGFFRFALTRDDAECPIGHFVAAGEPFVRPGKQDRAGESAFRHTLDMPSQHFSLLVLRMADRVHAELAENERSLAGEILQAQKVALELRLIVQVNVEAEKIDVLREQIFRRRKSGVGIKNVRIDCAPDANEMFHKLDHAMHAKPARHRARNFVAHQVTEHRRVSDITRHRRPHHFRDLVANPSFAQELNVLFPRKSDQDAHTLRKTFFQKPSRRRMINPQHVDSDLAHHAKIDIDALWRSERVAFLVRLEWPIRRSLDEKFTIAFEKEFRDDADP